MFLATHTDTYLLYILTAYTVYTVHIYPKLNAVKEENTAKEK